MYEFLVYDLEFIFKYQFSAGDPQIEKIYQFSKYFKLLKSR